MSETRNHYWLREHPARTFGAELAALRRGAGKAPGSVPQMWPFYTTLNPDGRCTKELAAEHVALTLYAMHQQSELRPMHQPGSGPGFGPGVGTAMRALRRSGKFSEEAVDRRFAAAATATSLPEAALHLRGLISQLKTIDQPLDYTRLFYDLRDWQHPDRIADVRRRWGSQDHAYEPTTQPSASVPSETPTAVPAQEKP